MNASNVSYMSEAQKEKEREKVEIEKYGVSYRYNFTENMDVGWILQHEQQRQMVCCC